MTAGIRVLGDNGSIQIDENYANLALRSTGTVTLSGSLPARGNVDITAVNPIIAFNHATSTSTWVDRLSNLGSNVWRVYFSARAVGTVTFWVFDDISTLPVPTDNFGIRVFKEDGGLAYHSSYKVMKVVAVHLAQPLTNGTVTPMTTIIPSGRTYAAVQGSNAFYERQTESDNQSQVPAGMLRYSRIERGTYASNTGSDITTGMTLYESYNTILDKNDGEFDQYYGTVSHLILDVTGY